MRLRGIGSADSWSDPLVGRFRYFNISPINFKEDIENVFVSLKSVISGINLNVVLFLHELDFAVCTAHVKFPH
jgi:hypothetical protein